MRKTSYLVSFRKIHKGFPEQEPEFIVKVSVGSKYEAVTRALKMIQLDASKYDITVTTYIE